MSVNDGAHRENNSRRRNEQSNLPDWLRDVEIEVESDDDISWAADIDFSNLPGWLAPETQDEAESLGIPEWLEEPAVEEEERQPEGSGLLAGIAGPIPIEPIIVLPHEAPPYPGGASQTVSAPAPTVSPLPGRLSVQPAESQGRGGARLVRLVLFVLILVIILAVVALAATALGVIDIFQLIPPLGV